MDKMLYVVYLQDVPIGVHRWPWSAMQEAAERSVEGKGARVVGYKFAYEFASLEDFEDESPTNPDCVPCSHGVPCDDGWKTNKSGAV